MVLAQFVTDVQLRLSLGESGRYSKGATLLATALSENVEGWVTKGFVVSLHCIGVMGYVTLNTGLDDERMIKKEEAAEMVDNSHKDEADLDREGNLNQREPCFFSFIITETIGIALHRGNKNGNSFVHSRHDRIQWQLRVADENESSNLSQVQSCTCS